MLTHLTGPGTGVPALPPHARACPRPGCRPGDRCGRCVDGQLPADPAIPVRRSVRRAVRAAEGGR